MSRGTAITGEPKGDRPGSLETLDKRLRSIERKLDGLAVLMTANPQRHMGSLSMLSGLPGLLVGHAEIARFIRKSPSAVRRYARHMAFPAIRFGRHVVSHPTMICQWLWAVETQRRRQRGLTG